MYSNIRLNLRHGCKREQQQQTATDESGNDASHDVKTATDESGFHISCQENCLRSETNMSLFVGGTKLVLTMTCLQNEITCCKFVNACQLKHFNPGKVEKS